MKPRMKKPISVMLSPSLQFSIECAGTDFQPPGGFHGGDLAGLPQSDHPVKVRTGRRWAALVGTVGLGDGDALLLPLQDVGTL